MTNAPDLNNVSLSQSLMERARKVIPGGVNSPVRAFNGVGGSPRFIVRGEGAHIFDADGNAYIDYLGSWGPLALGHANEAVLDAARAQMTAGLSFGAPTALEIRMAEKLCELLPSMDQVRMVNSGTEATMSAIRLARGATGRDLLVKFEGCYHGHSDSLLVKAGSGLLTLGVPTSPGVPESVTQHTLVLPYNDVAALAQAFSDHGDKIAAVIIEPVAGNMNCVPALPEFLSELRKLCTANGSVLIFDEVMSGFRVSLGSAQGHYGIAPDLTTLGKIVGGGMPVGAFGGRAELMAELAPVGPVYQAGTLSGNPLAMAAGLATLDGLMLPGVFERMARMTSDLCEGLESAAAKHDVALMTQHVGAMFGLFFTDQSSVTTFDEVTECDATRFAEFFHHMLGAGVYLAPSAFEAGFVSAAHDDALISETIAAAEQFFVNQAS